jgi:hypothetical protein
LSDEESEDQKTLLRAELETSKTAQVCDESDEMK